MMRQFYNRKYICACLDWLRLIRLLKIMYVCIRVCALLWMTVRYILSALFFTLPKISYHQKMGICHIFDSYTNRMNIQWMKLIGTRHIYCLFLISSPIFARTQEWIAKNEHWINFYRIGTVSISTFN